MILRHITQPPSHIQTPLLILVLLVLITLFAPVLATHDPLSAPPGASLQAPSTEHILGTDFLGRDVFSRVLFGGRQTLGIAALATAISLLPGMIIGVIGGFYNRWPSRLLMAGMDALLAFPNLLLALVLLSLTGSGAWQIALAVGISGLPAYARVTRTIVIQIQTEPYIEAAYAIGARSLRVILRYVLPNALGSLLSFGAITFSWAILNGAGLAFLGFGGDPATPDWGAMLNEGRAVFRLAPWIALFPGLAVTSTVFAVTRLADSWQDRQHRRGQF